MSVDEKEGAISAYNRQRAKSRRKGSDAVVVEDPKAVTTQIEPLVKEQETRSRRSRNNKPTSRAPSNDSRSRNDYKSPVKTGEINADHPITKRRRVQRDLSKVVFGPTQ